MDRVCCRFNTFDMNLYFLSNGPKSDVCRFFFPLNDFNFIIEILSICLKNIKKKTLDFHGRYI